MPKLKAEFRKPKLTLYNTNYVALGVLTNRTHLSAHNIVLNEQVNETPSLTFDFPMGGMLDGDSLELLIKYKNEYFVIKEISMSDSDTAIMNVRAEHIACELKGIMVGYFEDLIGETPETMWSTVIENSSMTEVLNDKYIFETNITNTFRWLGSEEEKSVFEYLLTMAQQFDSCLLFSTDTYGKIHIELLHGDINRNKFIRKGKDLKQLNLTFNTESLFTKLTPFGGTDDDGIEVNIMNVNDGKSYITNYDYYLAKGMTQAEIDANPLCNQECVYRNEEILDEDELLRLAQEELRRLSEPVVEGSISAIDLNVFEGGSYLSPILCEKVVVIDKDLKYSISCKITSIGLNFENPLESQIGISNVISYSSNLKDLIRNSEIVDRVITNGDNGRPNLNASKVKGIIDGHIAQLKYSMEDNITDVTDAVVLFENRIEGSSMYGALAIGSRGILISTKIDRVTNQWIWSTAIDAKGLSTQIVNAIEINGGQIRGDKISSYDEKTWINLDDGTFNFANRMFYDGQKFTIHLGDGTDLDEWKQQYEDDKALMDTELQDIKDSLGNLDDIVGDTFSDGIITEVERIRIEDSLIDLEKEKEDIKDRYTLIINDVGLTDGEEDALESAYASFNTKYTQLVQFINDVISDDKATESEKTKYQSKLRGYNETIPPLTVAFDNALKKIAENKAKTLINETKSDIERDIQNVQQSVDGLEETMLNSFRDGIIDETEYKTIKESVHRLNTEKLDIDRNYEHLSVNMYIQSKTELLEEFKDAYDNYVENHEILTSYVDETIGDRVATEEEITNINNMFNSYDEALAEYSVMQTKVMGEIADATASSNLDEYKEIVNRDITDVNTRINNLILDVGGAISDNILDQAELRIIENSITALETEKADIDKRYTELMKDTVNFKGDTRSALSNSYSNFNTAHTNLINSINDMIDENYATELEKQVYQDAINSYNTALSVLSSAFDKALNEIAKNSAQAIMETIRQEIQSDISDVQDNIDALEDYMGNAFRDGILSDAEKESIRTHLLTLATEKKDVEQQYTSLMGMTDLEGTAKTNLQNAYGNESKGYVQAYNSLINTINQILNKKTVNESDRTSLTNSFNNHDAKLANYSLRVNEAIESISEKKKQDLNNNITAKIETLQNAISLRVTATQMEEIITEKVEGIEVGGRNLVRNSAFMSGKTNWTFNPSVEIDSTQTFNGHPTVVSRQSGHTSAQWRGVNNKYLPNDPTSFKRGETLTVSCWYKATKSTFDAILAVEVKGYKNNSTTSQTILRASVSMDNLKEDWTQISATKTLDADWDKCYLSAWVEKNGTAWFTDFKLEKGNKVTDWTPSIEDTQLQFNALQDMADSLQNQVDGKIQTHYQSTDPSKNWTSTEKTAHEGDIWHDTLNNFTYRWNGSAWNKLTDADAEEAKTLANSKAQIFVDTPATPYYVGDLWVQGGNYDGEIMRCNNTRTSGKYTANDWSKASKYTDDSFATQLEERLDNFVIGGRNLLKNTAEQVMAMAGGTNIVRVLTLTVPASEIVGIDTTLSFDWRYEGDHASNGGTFKIQTGDPQYHQYGDTTTISSTNTSGRFVFTKKISSTSATFTTINIRCDGIVGDMIFTNIKLEKGNAVTDWSPAPEDTIDYADNLVYDLQGQIDNKIETHNQTTDPSTSWTTTELKNKHKGDLWYNPSTKLTKRWSGTAWTEQPEAETLAKTKKRVFTSTPTVPYDVGDLWVTSLDGTGEIKTCKTAKTSSQSYSASDWVAPKYTDDSFATQLEERLDNLVIGGRNLLKNTAEQVMTMMGGTNIVRGLTLTVPASEIVGIDTTLSFDWKYEGDHASNGGTFHVQTGNPQYHQYGNTITISSTNTSGRFVFTKKISSTSATFTTLGIRCDNIVGDMIFTNIKLEKGNTVTDWSPAPEDTEDYVDDLVYDLQGQIDNKIETHNQSADPSTSWTTTDLKNKHKGDLWYNPSTKLTKRWSGTAWVDQPEAETLAKSKRRVFTSTPTVPYDIGDLWVTKLDGTGEIKTCKTAKTSSQSYSASDWVAPKYTDDSRADEIADDLANNYYTITETEQKIQIAQGFIESTVSKTYTTKDDLGNTLTNYTKKTDLTQTVDDITATFTSSGGGNLVKNGELKNGNKFWTEHAYQLTGSNTTHSLSIRSDSYTGNEKVLQAQISSLTSGEYGFSQTIETVVGRQYVLTCYLAGRRANYNVIVRGTTSNAGGWLASRAYGTAEGGSNPNNWHQIVIPFVAQRTTTGINFVITSTISGQTDGLLWVKRVMVCEGTVWTPFVPHSSEVYTGITKIDQDGIEVSHSNTNTKSRMSADGFSILDENNEAIAWLTSKNTWTEIKADNVYANNIDNIYMGDANLYVDHSKTVAGSGTSSSPFNNFKALADYLQDTPILKKDLVINVVSTGNVTDNFDLRGIRGNGTIRINLAKTLVLNKSGANSAFYFYRCDVPITINGGRTGYDSTDGALLNQFNYGVFFNQCKYGCVEYLAIDTSTAGSDPWGVIFRGTNGKSSRIDFCDTPDAVLADYGSNVADYDSCGNCNIAFYAQSGANIVFGSSLDGGYRPAGSLVRNGGCVTDLGRRTATASKRKAPAVPPTSDKWQSFTYSDYGYFTPGTDDGINVNAWNPNGKRVYQGNWGYGNNRGIFTLPNSSINTFLSGATVLDGSTITLKRANSAGYSSAQTVYLCGTSHTSVSSGTPAVTKSYGKLGTLAWGEQKTFTLPKAFVTDLKAGTIKSVMFYTSDGSNYILFDTVCTLNIKVNK